MFLVELESLLEDAVRRQLVADVPAGVLLSGDVDSSVVTATVVRANGDELFGGFEQLEVRRGKPLRWAG